MWNILKYLETKQHFSKYSEFLALNAYNRKKEETKINDLSFHLKDLEKKKLNPK